MNGGHDLGGMMGFGPVNPEAAEPVFHEDWEARVLALTLAMGALRLWNIDTSRHARENMHPGLYTTMSYYQIWLAGLSRLLVQAGLASPEEIATGASIDAPLALDNKLMARDVAKVLAAGGPSLRHARTKALFKSGDQITTRNLNPCGHTRLARYLRGHTGEVVHVHGAHVFPDASAHGKGECPQWLYTVRFSARQLWGDEARTGDCVHADLWEPYLVPAS